MLMACGGGGDANVEAPQIPPGPLAAFTQQKLDWQACDPELNGEQYEEQLAPLGERARCALMRVPLDYDHPAQGELQIELLRVAAAQPQRRLGAIVFNPGGPGEDGQASALVYGAQWAQASPEDVRGTRLREMGNRYDLIGFSPRGTGASNPLVCNVAGSFEEQDSLTFNRSAENLQQAQHNARLMAQACVNNPLSQHIHTEATARDMDLIRGLLGDAQLHYIGYSYGTWLGNWYARLFPERVGRMLLDSSLNMVEGLDGQFMLQEMANQRILDEIMLPYAERHQDKLELGSAAALREALLALPPALQEALFDDIDFKDSSLIERAVLRMSAAVGLGKLMHAHPDADGEALQTLAQSHAFSPLPRINEAAVQMALELIKAQDEDENKVVEESWAEVDAQGAVWLLPEFTVNMTVRCNDTGSQGDEQYWLGVSNDYVARYPMVGGSGVAKPCLYWPAPPRKMPPLPAGQGLPILMLQSRYDGATPVESALATWAAWPNARMIMVEDEYEHGLFPYGTECVDVQVADYFLDGTLPLRTSSCAGKPLPGEAGA
ncbi:alpha/beta hydrolase [Pantoea sp. 18069]|uniref:alpha/beta hydrolase n=1 Tax=Pantoea sp. 18069 TaxID=2681415 RepID=UPI001356D3AA|nr:alpha/beta fold hydrolase [Pantoea sp. 18069]